MKLRIFWSAQTGTIEFPITRFSGTGTGVIRPLSGSCARISRRRIRILTITPCRGNRTDRQGSPGIHFQTPYD